ncbi:MAG: queuosine precursor transporter [Xanthomonadaceae bacterium]|nr:queuosine precursor transporter [Xanthomonadaceae bacterium]
MNDLLATTPPPRGYSGAFLAVTAGFVTALLVSNIIAVKLVQFGPWAVPAAVIVFPVSYIIGDILTEVYGYHRARLVIWIGFGCNLLATTAIAAAIVLPPAPFWPHQEAYEQILGFAPRLLLASFAAYLAGEFANAYVLARLKILTAGRWLWLRTIGSTLVGQGLDSMIFMIVAFSGIIPGQAIVAAAATQWLIKSGYEVLATPLTYLIVGLLKRHEGVDVYDEDTDFNPFRLRERR